MKSFLLILLLTVFSATSFSILGTSKLLDVAGLSRSDYDPEKDSALVFPVTGKRAFVGSFWGDAREGGVRKHEGIDIFAKKGTPVVAICDGIAFVGNGGKGGNYVWLRSADYSFTVYYAHLDKHSVQNGQWVKQGDVLGTVGKTGNARTTPPHLHLGIYTWTGAVNPLPYIKHAPKVILPTPKPEIVQNKKKTTTRSSSSKKLIAKTSKANAVQKTK